MDKNITDVMNCTMTAMGINDAIYRGSTSDSNQSCWSWWTDNYYPQVIRQSYPVYIQERAKDSGKQAFEIIKALQDKKLLELKKVSDFVEAMDTLIKIL